MLIESWHSFAETIERSEGRSHAHPVGPWIRIIDIIVSAALLIFFAPLMLLVALAIYCSDPGRVIFSQQRLGKDGRYFRCYKFRSMVIDAEAALQRLLATDAEARRAWEVDHKLKNDPRITSMGRFLRRSSLDELPQLFNVLRGDMSLVGPRPICDAEIVRYGRYFDEYCSVRPGITGLWQISGRNDVSYRRRVTMDVVFARNQSVNLYIHILIYTLPAVFLARGSY